MKIFAFMLSAGLIATLILQPKWLTNSTNQENPLTNPDVGRIETDTQSFEPLNLEFYPEPSQTSPKPESSVPLDNQPHAQTKNDAPLTLANYKNKILYINFWASWCGPCLKELPLIEKLNKENENIQILLVNVDSSSAEAQEAAELKKRLAPTLKSIKLISRINEETFDDDLFSRKKLLDYFRAAALPYHVIIDRDGKIKSHFVRDISKDFDKFKKELTE